MNTFAYVDSNPLNYIDPFGLCSLLDLILGSCSKPVENLEELAEKWVQDVCNKPCDAIVKSCKQASGPACYIVGTPCTSHCEKLKIICEEKQKKVCTISQCSDGLNYA